MNLTVDPNNPGSYSLTLSELELDALRVPLGRITGDPDHWVRKAAGDFYFAAGDLLGYRDDVRALGGYLQTNDRPRTPPEEPGR